MSISEVRRTTLTTLAERAGDAVGRGLFIANYVCRAGRSAIKDRTKSSAFLAPIEKQRRVTSQSTVPHPGDHRLRPDLQRRPKKHLSELYRPLRPVDRKRRRPSGSAHPPDAVSPSRAAIRPAPDILKIRSLDHSNLPIFRTLG